MARDYIRPYAIPDTAGVRILIDPTWKELCAALQQVQKGCRLNRIHASQLKKLQEQARDEDFFSACLMTAEEAPSGYGFDYRSTQVAACRLDDVTGFVLKREATSQGDYVKSPVYPLTPKDDGFNYLDWLDSVARIFWTRLKDDEIDFLQMKPIVEKLLKEYQDRLAAQHPDKKWYAAQLKRLKRRPLAPEQLSRRRQREDERAARRKAEHESQLKERQEQKSHAGKQKELERRKNEENKLKLIGIMVNGKEPTFVSYWQDNYESILLTLKAEGKGSVSWKELQRRWTSLTATCARHIIPLIKNGAVSLADLADVEPVPMFSLSIGLWTGSQRLFQRNPQLVFRINSQGLYTLFAGENLETRMAVNEALLNVSSGHPADEWNVGWLRVHKDGANKLAFIDEVQSDALEELRQTYRPCKDRQQYLTNGRKKLEFLDGQEVRRIERALRPWNLHGFASVKHWAHSIGYRAAIHSRESAQKKPGMTPSDRKWNTYYAPIISQYRLAAESVPGYPAQIMVEKG